MQMPQRVPSPRPPSSPPPLESQPAQPTRRCTLPSLHLPSKSMTFAKRLVSRTVLAKVYANDKCARRLYSQSPVLPEVPYGPSAGSIWRKVSRPRIPDYVKGLVHYEHAVQNDVSAIIDFWNNKIGPQSPLLHSIGAKSDDMLELVAPVVERSVKDDCSLLGFVGDELIGFSLHSIREVNGPSEAYDPEKPADVIPKKDFKEEIDAAPYKARAAKKMWVFWHALSENFESLLPGARRLMFIELGGISPEYQQRGLSTEMVQHALRLAKDKFQCDYVLVVADSKPSQKLYEQKLEFKLLRELKLDHFYDGEAHVFPYMKNEVFSGKLLGKKL